MKICKTCEIEKENTEFHFSRTNKDRLRSNCKSCRSIEAKSKYTGLSSEQKKKKKQYILENVSRIKETARQWRIRNKEKFAQVKKEWQQKNANLSNIITAKRRATKKQAVVGWANSFFISEIYTLAKLREKLLGGKWEVDHIVPLTSDIVCGLHCESNLRVIRSEENKSKSNRYWPNMPERLGLRVAK